MSTAVIARIPLRFCPTCGEKIDAATASDTLQEGPKPGDVNICLYCAEVSKFGEELDIVKLEDDEMKEVLADPRISRARELVKKMIAERRTLN